MSQLIRLLKKAVNGAFDHGFSFFSPDSLAHSYTVKPSHTPIKGDSLDRNEREAGKGGDRPQV